MIRFREFLAGTLVSKSTVIAKNVRSFFEINCPFESKHDRTQHLSSMTRKMTVVSKAAEGIQSHLSKRASSSYRRESHQSFEESIIFISKGKPSIFRREYHQSSRSDRPSIISKRKPSSFRKESQSFVSKRQSGHHFKTIALSAINHPLI